MSEQTKDRQRLINLYRKRWQQEKNRRQQRRKARLRIEELEPRIQPDAYGFTVPAAHPRVLFNATTLAAARTWYVAHPFTPPSSGDPWNEALGSLLTTNSTNAHAWAQDAITDALAWKDDPTLQQLFQSQTSSSAADQYRYADWYSEVVDWCWGQATADQQNRLVNDVGGNWGYAHISWSELEHNYSRTYPWDNYFAGFFRNAFTFSIGAYYEMAPSDLSRIQADLFGNTGDPNTNGYWVNFLNWSADTGMAGGNPGQPGYQGPGVYGEGAGGAPPQGSAYGQVLMSYYVVPFITAANSARDLASETNWFDEALVNLVYWTTMGPTYALGQSYFQLATYGTDDQDGQGYTGIAEAGRTYIADFCTWESITYPTTMLGQVARYYLNATHIVPDNYLAAIDPGGTATAPASWPIDWFANGAGEMFVVHDQFGVLHQTIYQKLGQWTEGGAAHQTRDVATFQITYNRTWLSKADSGYDTGWADGTNSYDTASDNGLLFGGAGEYFIGPSGKENFEDYYPTVTRLESRANYSYAECHVSNSDTQYAYNAYEGAVDRTFLFIRPFNYYLVLDRMAGDGVSEDFLLHTEVTPTITAGQIDEVNNGMELVSNSLLNPTATITPVTQRTIQPPTPQMPFWSGQVTNVVNHESRQGSTSGVDYFLHGIQVGAQGFARAVAVVTDLGDYWRIVLTQGSQEAVIDLNKGQTVQGGVAEGDFGYSASGVPTTAPLTTAIQSISVNQNGPFWGS